MNRPVLIVALAAALAASAAFFACLDQGDQQRCDTHGVNNGSDECQAGFVCTPAAELPGNQLADLCCPAPGQPVDTSGPCAKVGSGDGGGVIGSIPDTGAPSDANNAVDSTPDGTTPDATPDAPAEAAPDANTPADGGSDAPADAPDGG